MAVRHSEWAGSATYDLHLRRLAFLHSVMKQGMVDFDNGFIILGQDSAKELSLSLVLLYGTDSQTL